MNKNLKEESGLTINEESAICVKNKQKSAPHLILQENKFSAKSSSPSRGEETYRNNNRKCAFTLAEVLITLGIIGIVSAMTIPTLIKEYDKKQTVAKLKQTYSILSQAITRAQVDNGDIVTWSLKNINGQEVSKNYAKIITTDFFNIYLKPYIKISKDFGFQDASSISKYYNCCYYPESNNPQTQDKNGYGYYFVLSNGTVINLLLSNKCVEYDSDGACTKILFNSIGFRVGIDGLNKKTISGKNLFDLQINSDKNILEFVSYGAYTRNSALKICRSIALTCGQLIRLDNWEIKEDYPWW